MPHSESVLPIGVPIAPTEPTDGNSTHIAEYGRGGLHCVADIAARNAIAPDRKKVGMLVHVGTTSTYYRLSALPSTWVEITLGGGGDVDSVNGQTGTVVLGAADVGAAASVHGHAIADVSGLQGALDGKAASSHGHVIADVSGLQTALDGKAATVHTHVVADVSGLQTALDGKAATSHTHGNITNAGAIGSTSGLPIRTGNAGLLEAGAFGTSAGTFCEGNDARLALQTITLTGDVTGSGTGSFAATIANNQVTYAKIQDVTAGRVLGRGSAAGAGDPQEIQIGPGLFMSGTYLGWDRAQLDDQYGDVDVTNSGATWTIPNDTVTYAKMQNVSASSRLLGRGDSGSGDPQEITLGSGLSMSGTTLSATGGGGGVSDGDKGDITVSGSGATWTIDDDAVTFAKFQNIATDRLLGRSSAGAGDPEEIVCTAYARGLLDDADAVTARATIEVPRAYQGTSAPSSGLGVDGDLYFDTANVSPPTMGLVVSGNANQLNYLFNSPTNEIEFAGLSGSCYSNTISGGGTSTNKNIIYGDTALRTIGGGYNNVIGIATITGNNDTIASTIGGGAHHRIGLNLDNALNAVNPAGTVPPDHGTICGGSYGVIANGSYGTICGGTINTIYETDNGGGGTATGAYAFIGGGVYNIVSGTAGVVTGGNTNRVLAQNGFIGGGVNNLIDGTKEGANYKSGCAIPGGSGNIIRCTNQAAILGGINNTIGSSISVDYGHQAAILGGSGNYIGNGVYSPFAAILGGANNTVNASAAIACGRNALATISGQFVQGGQSFAANGDAQSSVLVLKATTTNATATTMTSQGATPVVPNDTTWGFKCIIAARNTGSDVESAAYEATGCVSRSIGGAMRIVGTPSVTVIAEDVAAWDVAVAVGGSTLQFNVTGEVSKTIRWVARLELTEVSG